MNNELMFIWSGQKCRRGEYSPVFYCNNKALIGETFIDNSKRMINRTHKQQAELKFGIDNNGHYWQRRISRDISVLETIVTMQHGIRFRSDVKSGRRWIKRAVYLFRNFVVVSQVHPKHLVTCYKIDPISKPVFDLCKSLTEEEWEAVRRTLKKTVQPKYRDYNISID